MFTMFTEARNDGDDATDKSDDAIKIALIVVSVALALAIVAVLVAVALLRRLTQNQRRAAGAKQQAYTSPVAERISELGENANYSTLEL